MVNAGRNNGAARLYVNDPRVRAGGRLQSLFGVSQIEVTCRPQARAPRLYWQPCQDLARPCPAAHAALSGMPPSGSWQSPRSHNRSRTRRKPNNYKLVKGRSGRLSWAKRQPEPVQPARIRPFSIESHQLEI